MPQCSSESSLVSTVLSPVRLDSGNLVVHDESGYHSRVDLEELNYNNRELVNLENAAVNIENSSDVIIGPVTQFNVNGNVTIYQNGQENHDGENRNRDENEAQATGGNENSCIPRKVGSSCVGHLECKHSSKMSAMFLIVLICVIVAGPLTYQLMDPGVQPNKEGYFGDYIGRHRIYYKEDWKGKPAVATIKLTKIPNLVIISHTGNSSCYSLNSCSLELRRLQDYFIDDKYADIGYNFLIGQDGNVYVGRGWDLVNFHPQYSVGISFIGNYDQSDYLNDDMIDATKKLLELGLNRGKMTVDYFLLGHNQTTSRFSHSPGKNVVEVIKTWGHYSPKVL